MTENQPLPISAMQTTLNELRQGVFGRMPANLTDPLRPPLVNRNHTLTWIINTALKILEHQPSRLLKLRDATSEACITMDNPAYSVQLIQDIVLIVEIPVVIPYARIINDLTDVLSHLSEAERMLVGSPDNRITRLARSKHDSALTIVRTIVSATDNSSLKSLHPQICKLVEDNLAVRDRLRNEHRERLTKISNLLVDSPDFDHYFPSRHKLTTEVMNHITVQTAVRNDPTLRKRIADFVDMHDPRECTEEIIDEYRQHIIQRVPWALLLFRLERLRTHSIERSCQAEWIKNHYPKWNQLQVLPSHFNGSKCMLYGVQGAIVATHEVPPRARHTRAFDFHLQPGWYAMSMYTRVDKTTEQARKEVNRMMDAMVFFFQQHPDGTVDLKHFVFILDGRYWKDASVLDALKKRAGDILGRCVTITSAQEIALGS